MNYFCCALRLAMPLFAMLQGVKVSGSDAVQDLHHEKHAHHPHHFGVFLGGATRFERDEPEETGMSIGLDYEYRWSRNWGVGGLIEGVVLQDNHRDLAVVIPVSWHPIGALKFSAGPGFETDRHHLHFLFRTSVAYQIEVGKFTLSPEVAVDFADRAQTLVYGISIGRGF